MAALEGGVITPSTPITDPGGLTVGGITFHNAGGGAYGTLSLPSALQVSDDVFFYTLGLRMNGTYQLQQWARKFGLGSPTGIRNSGRSTGLSTGITFGQLPVNSRRRSPVAISIRTSAMLFTTHWKLLSPTE